MNIWRLIAHHRDSDEAIEIMKSTHRVAIGWPKIGDLQIAKPTASSDISELIKNSHPQNDNSHLGGPSLWRFYDTTKEGDMVIVNAGGKRRCVFEIIGPYYFDRSDSILGYTHLRAASLTSINPEDLWQATGSSVADGESQRWAYVACALEEKAKEQVYLEGDRYSISSTAIERNPRLRRKCIEIYGYTCAVCAFNFEEFYGDIGREFIHIHHRKELSSLKGPANINPETDLIPLCPNCHAMVHREKPAMDVERLTKMVGK